MSRRVEKGQRLLTTLQHQPEVPVQFIGGAGPRWTRCRGVLCPIRPAFIGMPALCVHLVVWEPRGVPNGPPKVTHLLALP